MNRLASVAVVAVLVLGCATSSSAPGTDRAPETPVTVASPSAAPSPGASPLAGSIALCEEVDRISAPAQYYRDSPIYVANEMPSDQVRDWARRQPGFEEIWIDRDHLGWITLAFSRDAEARQAELEELFPGVGVVVVQVDWTMSELEALQRRVIDELPPDVVFSSGIYVDKGVVSVGIGPLTAERIAVVERRFAGERVCLEGANPADVPVEGPQQPAGDGWRLLADEPGVGMTYRTGIATDESTYETLWEWIGLGGERPAVDFESEVVVYFGAVYGSSCPSLRLDDVVIDRGRSLLYAEIVLVNAFGACTEDANPRAYVVAVERAKLPAGPFAIQLDAERPPRGAPEERTVVDVDLSRPGAVAGPTDVHADPSLPEPAVLGPGAIVEPDYPAEYRLNVHCGVGWLGPVNAVYWRTDVPDGVADYVPAEWRPLVESDSIVVSILVRLAGDEPPALFATANGHTLLYRATAEQPPGCD